MRNTIARRQTLIERINQKIGILEKTKTTEIEDQTECENLLSLLSGCVLINLATNEKIDQGQSQDKQAILGLPCHVKDIAAD